MPTIVLTGNSTGGTLSGGSSYRNGFSISGTLADGQKITSVVVAVTGVVTGGAMRVTLRSQLQVKFFDRNYSAGTINASYTLGADDVQRFKANGQWPSTRWEVGGMSSPASTLSGFTVTITVTTATETYTGPTTDTPNSQPPRPGLTPAVPAPTPSPAPAPIKIAFTSIPATPATVSTNYTLTIDVTRNGVRDPSVTGTLSVKLLYGATAATTAISWLLGATTAVTQSMTVTDGRATGTMQIPAAASTAGKYAIQVVSGTLSAGSHSGGLSPVWDIVGQTVGTRTTKFTVQPASTVSLGAALSCTVAVIDGNSGSTVTGYTGTVALELLSINGESVTNRLQGSRTKSATAGVAAFTGLSITEPGQYRLKATAQTNDGTSTSTVVSVVGLPVPGDIVGIRQNILKDGTLFVGTTGYPTVSGNPTISATEKTYLDGDMSSTNNKTLHGVRLVFPHLLALEKVETKFKVSTVTGTPIIRVLYSLDTTTGTDGTWTLLTSYTPANTAVHIRTFVLTTPVFVKGLWVTLDQGSGSASNNWYAVHPFGGYVNSPISVLNTNATVVDNEGILSIPYPAVPISGATTKTRDLILRNNTSTAYVLSASVLPAREGGDSAVDNEVQLLDENGAVFPEQFSLPAYGSKPFRLRYLSASAPTSLDGDHLIRFSLRSAGEDTSYGLSVSPSTAIRRKHLDGTTLTDSTVATHQAMCPGKVPGADHFSVVKYHTSATTVRFWSWEVPDPELAPVSAGAADQNITSAGTKTEYTRILARTLFTGYVTRESQAAVYNYDTTEADMTEAAWLATAGRVAFTLPATTSGAKTMMWGKDGNLWVANGRTSNLRIYQMDQYGVVLTTIDTTIDLNGLTIDCHCYDPLNDEVYVITRPSGGVRKIARYNAATGAFIAAVNNSDEGGTGNAEGCSVVGSYLYVYYDGRYLNRYDLTTLANNVRKYDDGARTYADACWRGVV